MYSKEIENHLPVAEKEIYRLIAALPKVNKLTFWNIVRRSDKNSVVLLNPLDSNTIYFVKNEIIVENSMYKGSKFKKSYFVLPNAPYLLRELKHLKKKSS